MMIVNEPDCLLLLHGACVSPSKNKVKNLFYKNLHVYFGILHEFWLKQHSYRFINFF